MKLLVGLLLVVAGCLAGCKSSSAQWDADDITMGTQFEVRCGTEFAIGFPGTVKGNAQGAGTQEAKPDVPVTPPVP